MGGIRPGGFTLLEVIMGVALISLLFGGIYGIANASVDLGRSVSENRLKEMRVSGLVNLLRNGFESLPPGSRLELPEADGVSERGGAVRVIDAPGLWAWSEATAGADAVALILEEGTSGTDLILAHLRALEGSAFDSEDAQFEIFSRATLIRLDSFRWEFFDPETGGWVPEWPEARERPPLVAAHFGFAGDPAARRHVFAVAPEVDPDSSQGENRAPTNPNGNTNRGGTGGR